MPNYNKTPFLQEMKNQGGTLYVFPSASEDIGLNLNSRTNGVALSHYALLNIPNCDTINSNQDTETLGEKNLFNLSYIPGQYEYMTYNNDENSYSRILAMSLQNYAMNFETTLLNRDEYDYSAMKTVSERVFWKWLKETGAIRWDYSLDASENKIQLPSSKIYQEESSENYESVVKCLGAIGSGNSLSSQFGMYNETYVNIPTSYGAGKVFFRSVEDTNYKLGRVYSTDPDYLQGRESDIGYFVDPTPFGDIIDSSTPDYKVFSIEDNGTHNYSSFDNASPALWFNLDEDNIGRDAQGIFLQGYITDSRIPDNTLEGLNYFVKYQGSSEAPEDCHYFLRSKLDGVEIVKDLSSINTILRQQYELENYVNYDNINIDLSLGVQERFDFNAILLYYSVYNINDVDKTPQAINLFGILFLDGIYNLDDTFNHNTGVNMGFYIPSLTKIKSSEEGFGTGYSFRVNIKTSSIYDSRDSVIQDNTTATSVTEQDFNSVLGAMNQAISQLNQNSEAVQQISRDYSKIVSYYELANRELQSLTEKLNAYLSGERSSELNTQTLYSTEISPGKTLDDSTLIIKFAIDRNNDGEVEFENLINITPDKANFVMSLSTDGSLNSSVSITNNDIVERDFSRIHLQTVETDELFDTSVMIPFLNTLQVRKRPEQDILADTDLDQLNELSTSDPEYYIVPIGMSGDNSADSYKKDLEYLLLREESSQDVIGINYAKFVPLLLGYCQYLYQHMGTGTGGDSSSGGNTSSGSDTSSYTYHTKVAPTYEVLNDVGSASGDPFTYVDL